MKIEEFKALKKGDLVKVMVNGYARYEKVETEPYYNPDCDEPTWEIVTNNATYSYESVEKAEGKSLSEEDRVFLAALRKEMKTQDNCCQAAPRYWGIEETVREYGVEEGYGEDYVLQYDGEIVAKDIKDGIELLDDNIDTLCNAMCATNMISQWDPEGEVIDVYFKDDEDTELEYFSFRDLKDLAEFISDNGGKEYDILWYKEVHKMVNGPIFLTKKACEEYLKKYGYNHAANAHPYAMTAYRSPEVENLWRIVEETDWENI